MTENKKTPWHAALPDTADYRLSQNEAFPLGNVSDDMYRVGRRSFLSWFYVNRPTFNEDIHDYYFFVPGDLDLWPLDLKFALLVTLVQGYVSIKLEVFYDFPISRKLEDADGRPVRRKDKCNT